MKYVTDGERRIIEAALREIARFTNVPQDSSAWSVYMMVPEDLRATAETSVDPDDAPELTGEELSHKDGVFRIGGKVVSREEGLAAFKAALNRGGVGK